MQESLEEERDRKLAKCSEEQSGERRAKGERKNKALNTTSKMYPLGC
jgi:hypothetical protein